MKTVIYLAHKIRDPRGPYWMNKHIQEAAAVSIELWRMGAATICPGLNTYLFDGVLPDEIWLKGDLEIITRCDAVVMHPNWPTSEGAKLERMFAIEKEIEVFDWATEQERIQEFIKQGSHNSEE
jgi:nucleoside 2-deoxyribosyltransferase